MSSYDSIHLDDDEKLYANAIVSMLEGLYKFPERISEIYDHLYLGCEKDARDIRNLKQLGITHIVNTVDG